MKYSVSKGQQQEDVLFVDGKQSICPYTAPIPFQGNMGQVQIMRMPCCTLCPHASLKDNEWKVTCGAEAKTIVLEESTTTDEPKPTSKLVSL